jgi:hypothetical protein
MNQEANKPVLLFSAGFSNLALMDRLIEDYSLAIFDENLARWLRDLGIPCLSVNDFVNPQLVEQVRGVMIWETKKIMEAIVTGDLTIDKNHPLMHGQGLGTWFPHYMFERMSEMAIRVLAAGILAQQHPIAGMVVNEDVSAHGKAVTLFGMGDGYPTIHLAHANHFIKSGTTDLHCQTTAPLIGAAGEYMKQWYVDCGHPAEDIKLLGCPQWDYLYDQTLMPTKEQSRRAFGFTEDKPVLTFASTWPQMVSAGGRTWAKSIKVLDETWMTFLNVAKKMNAYVAVKMHPTGGQGRQEFFMEQMKEAGVKGAIMRDHGQHATRAADCVVLQTSSNFGVEAAILGVPAVELYTPGSRVPYIPGTWGEDLEDMVAQAIKDGPSEELVRTMNYKNDGEATDRTIAWIKENCPPE